MPGGLRAGPWAGARSHCPLGRRPRCTGTSTRRPRWRRRPYTRARPAARSGTERAGLGNAWPGGHAATRRPASLPREATRMRYYCEFTWFPGTTAQEVRRRILQQHEAGKNHPERIKGWYNLAGGGAGFLLVDYDDPRQLTEFLQPYMDLVSFDVRAVYELDYNTAID